MLDVIVRRENTIPSSNADVPTVIPITPKKRADIHREPVDELVRDNLIETLL